MKLKVVGAPLGRIEQRFALLRRRFDLFTVDGSMVAEIVGPLFRPWTFEVRRPGVAEEIGRIEKRWSGLGRELFTDADSFALTLPPDPTRLLGRLLLASAILIDFCYFEREGPPALTLPGIAWSGAAAASDGEGSASPDSGSGDSGGDGGGGDGGGEGS